MFYVHVHAGGTRYYSVKLKYKNRSKIIPVFDFLT